LYENEAMGGIARRRDSPEQVSAVSERGAGSQRDRDEDGFPQLGLGRAGCKGGLAVHLNAVRTLRRERDGNCHQLLVFPRDCSRGERRLVERPKARHRRGGQLPHRGDSLEVGHVKHRSNLSTSW